MDHYAEEVYRNAMPALGADQLTRSLGGFAHPAAMAAKKGSCGGKQVDGSQGGRRLSPVERCALAANAALNEAGSVSLQLTATALGCVGGVQVQFFPGQMSGSGRPCCLRAAIVQAADFAGGKSALLLAMSGGCSTTFSRLVSQIKQGVSAALAREFAVEVISVMEFCISVKQSQQVAASAVSTSASPTLPVASPLAFVGGRDDDGDDALGEQWGQTTLPSQPSDDAISGGGDIDDCFFDDCYDGLGMDDVERCFTSSAAPALAGGAFFDGLGSLETSSANPSQNSSPRGFAVGCAGPAPVSLGLLAPAPAAETLCPPMTASTASTVSFLTDVSTPFGDSANDVATSPGAAAAAGGASHADRIAAGTEHARVLCLWATSETDLAEQLVGEAVETCHRLLTDVAVPAAPGRAEQFPDCAGGGHHSALAETLRCGANRAAADASLDVVAQTVLPALLQLFEAAAQGSAAASASQAASHQGGGGDSASAVCSLVQSLFHPLARASQAQVLARRTAGLEMSRELHAVVDLLVAVCEERPGAMAPATCAAVRGARELCGGRRGL